MKLFNASLSWKKCLDLSFKKTPKWFVSYSYKDGDYLQALKEKLPPNVVPVVFPPIDAPLTEFVSEPMLESIESCESLVFVDTPNSRASFWVPLEIEHAKRQKKRIYKFSPARREISEDQSPPIELPVYVSFAAVDEVRVREIALWAKHKRNFDLWYQEQIGILNSIFEKTTVELERTMKAGGYLVAFVSAWSATRGNLRDEVTKAKAISPNNVLLAWLDDPAGLSIPGVVVPEDMQIFLRPTTLQEPEPNPAKLQRRRLKSILAGKDLPVLARDIDDLIVRVYWLRWSGKFRDQRGTINKGEQSIAPER
ncbi:MAG: hypothetical protein OEN50_12740 [Deltaproteobacteria bacterium]|nr:hypothetical protein [Deltaproteobacteria bacterium]